MLADSHAHFMDGGIEEAAAQVARATAAGVGMIVAVGGCDATNASARAIGLRSGTVVRVALGLDRGEARRWCGPGNRIGMAGGAVAALLDGLAGEGVEPAAIGEIGLDFHYEANARREQVLLCEEQLCVARERGLPVIWHSRDAHSETVELLARHAGALGGAADRLGVVHCFTGDVGQARSLLDIGLYIGFSGIITFPKAEEVRRAAAYVPTDRLLVETDSPYLAPVPLRGSRNEPANVRYVVATLAGLRGEDESMLADATFVNAKRLFGLNR